MATITNFKVFVGGNRIRADAFGNNVAFECKCGHPVLAIAVDDQRGSHKGNPAECRKCGEKYIWERINEKANEIHIRALGGIATSKQTRADYRYALEIATRWSDFDMMMHLNNVQYYRYFECVVLSYLASIGADLLRDPIIPFAVESNCKFLRPITPAPVIDAALRVARVGNSSVQYEIGLFEKRREMPAAVGRFVHVYLGRETQKSTEIPGWIREGLVKITV